MMRKRLSLLSVIVLILAFVGYLWFMNRQRSSGVPLRLSSGDLERRDETGNWTPVGPGAVISPGESIRSVAVSGATLDFGGIAVADLSAGTTLEIYSLAPSLRLGSGFELDMTSGAFMFRTLNEDIRPLRMAIRTPSGTSRIEANQYSVFVESGRGTLFVLDRGQLIVEAIGASVHLGAGQATWVKQGESPAPPAYSFHLRGEVTEVQEDTLILDGQRIEFPAAWTGRVFPGASIRLAGHILPGGPWVADWLGLAGSGRAGLSFTGPLFALDAQNWQVGELLTVVDRQTVLVGDPTLGDVLRVEVVLDPAGQFRVRKAVRLGGSPGGETRGTLSTPASKGGSGLIFKESGLNFTGCDLTPVLEGTLLNNANPADWEAAPIVLGYIVTSGEPYLDSISVEPGAWQSIPPGGKVTFQTRLHLKETWLAAPTGTQLQISVFLSGGDRQPESSPGELTLTFQQACP